MFVVMKRLLTNREEQVFQILWKLKQAFVKEILMEMESPKPPYNTVSSIIRKLESEGLIGHKKYGNTYQYFPILKKESYLKSKFKHMYQQYFSGSAEQFLSFFVEEEKLDSEKIDAILEKLKKQS